MNGTTPRPTVSALVGTQPRGLRSLALKLGALGALSLTALQCGSSAASTKAFSKAWQNDYGASIAQVYDRVRAAELPSGPAVAVGITADGLVGLPLNGGDPWTYAAEVDARPTIAGNTVVGSGNGQLFALDAQTGRLRWSTSTRGRALRGAGDSGNITVASLGAPNGGNSLLLVVDRQGNELQSIHTSEEIGVPAVLADIAFVPWGEQYVSAFDISSGNEVGRLLMRDQVSHARSFGGELYFGEERLLRWDDQAKLAYSGKGRKWELPKLLLPGDPKFLGPGNQVRSPSGGATEKVRWYAKPVLKDDRIVTDSERIAATYFDAVMGFDAKSADLEWALVLPAAALGGDSVDGGFVFCDESGKVTLVEGRTGAVTGQLDLGTELIGCVVQADSLALPKSQSVRPLTERLSEVVRSPRSHLAPAQAIVLRELGSVNDPIVTKALIDIVTDSQTPKVLLPEARNLLAARRTGVEYMLEALAQHYDFLGDVLRSPPVGPLAQALGAMGESRAAPLLAEHLNDPADTREDIASAARALEGLATPKELPEMRTFFALYRATASDAPMVQALISIARAMHRVGGEQERLFLRMAAEDPLTNPEVRRVLHQLAT